MENLRSEKASSLMYLRLGTEERRVFNSKKLEMSLLQTCVMKIFKKELLKETVEPDKALAIAINTEIGTLNQLKMNASKSELNSTVNQVQRMRIANATPFSKMNTTAR